jgi:hypothetical protein
MGWGRDWSERPPRPKVKKLSDDEKVKILASMDNSIKNSPVLTALNYRVSSLRGRFYYEKILPGSDIEIMGRVTPLVTPKDNLLLEVEFDKGNWKEIVEGNIRTITNAVSGDKKGTFHGLGILDKSIRLAKKKGMDKVTITRMDGMKFYYIDSKKECRVQEVLFHYFGVPISVIAEPREWYVYHRTPHIREINKNNDKILIGFTSFSSLGDGFGGTCLYMKKDGNGLFLQLNQIKIPQ